MFGNLGQIPGHLGCQYMTIRGQLAITFQGGSSNLHVAAAQAMNRSLCIGLRYEQQHIILDVDKIVQYCLVVCVRICVHLRV